MQFLISGLLQKAKDMQYVINETTLHSAMWSNPEDVAYYASSFDANVVVIFAQSPYRDLREIIVQLKGFPVIVATVGAIPLNSAEMVKLFALGWVTVLHQPSLDAVVAQAMSLMQFKNHCITSDLSIGNLTCNLNAQVMRIDEIEVRLPRKEFLLLEILIRRREKLVRKLTLQDMVFGDASMEESAKSDKLVDVYVCKLRKKISDRTSQVNIRTLYNQGYILTENREYLQ